MKNTKSTKKIKENKITERVFKNETILLDDILNKYLENKVEKIINSVYSCDEVRAISNENKAVL